MRLHPVEKLFGEIGFVQVGYNYLAPTGLDILEIQV